MQPLHILPGNVLDQHAADTDDLVVAGAEVEDIAAVDRIARPLVDRIVVVDERVVPNNRTPRSNQVDTPGAVRNYVPVNY